MSELLRGGRLAPTRKDVADFTSSLKDDVRIMKHVININKAHTLMLVEKKIIRKDDGREMLKALQGLGGQVELKDEVEDIHMAVEEAVIKAVGMEVGGNLNLAKSRNDQVATAVRMQLREEILELMDSILQLHESLLAKSKEETGSIIPGYTHLQPAQPITFAHYLTAQFDALDRDLKRLKEAYSRVNLCPMGAAALATTSFPISRERVSELLGFSGLVENSLDAVSSRDFLLEVLAIFSIMSVDLTRFVEDLIIWSAMDFGIIELPDEFTSTSSIMPQKKNPEVLEVIRARMSLIIGNFFSAASVLKALPSGYNLDFQEVTPKLWGSIDLIKSSLKILSALLPKIKVKPDFLDKPYLTFMTATELANILVKKHGIPFRTAHKIVGALVKTLVDEGKSLKDLTPKLLEEASKKFLPHPVKISLKELREAVDPSIFVESHRVRGGPSKEEVKRMIALREETLTLSKRWVQEEKRRLVEAIDALNSEIESFLEGEVAEANCRP